MPSRTTKRVPADNLRKFGRHIQMRKAPANFRFNLSINNTSLLARRARTNGTELAKSSSGSLVPTNVNCVDLVTPEPRTTVSPPNTRVDSGYITGPNDITPPSVPSPLVDDKKSWADAATNSISTTIKPTSVSEYKSSMVQSTEQVFFREYISKNFTHDSRKARKQLEPILRTALDRVEDRPWVDKIYLHINFKNRTIRGEKRRERFRHLRGRRAQDYTQREWETDCYLLARDADSS